MKTAPLLLGLLITALSSHAFAKAPVTLTVEITGVKDKVRSTVICALFDRPTGFPMDSSQALQIQDAKINQDRGFCEFSVEPDKVYAVSVGHDENGNRKVDTNLFGVPTEGWGTTNNVTHTFRAPNFEESKVRIEDINQKATIVLHY